MEGTMARLTIRESDETFLSHLDRRDEEIFVWFRNDAITKAILNHGPFTCSAEYDGSKLVNALTRCCYTFGDSGGAMAIAKIEKRVVKELSVGDEPVYVWEWLPYTISLAGDQGVLCSPVVVPSSLLLSGTEDIDWCLRDGVDWAQWSDDQSETMGVDVST